MIHSIIQYPLDSTTFITYRSKVCDDHFVGVMQYNGMAENHKLT